MSGVGFGKGVVWVVARVMALLCMILAAGILGGISATLGFGFSLLVMVISGVVIIRPFPRFGLDSRAFAGVALLLFGLSAGGSAIEMNRTRDAVRLVDLKSSDPAAYLDALREDTPSLWLKELAVLDPAKFEIEKARPSGQGTSETDAATKNEAYKSAELEKAMKAVADERAAQIKAAEADAAAKVAAKIASDAERAAQIKAAATDAAAKAAAKIASDAAIAETKVADDIAAATKKTADFESWKGQIRAMV